MSGFKKTSLKAEFKGRFAGTGNTFDVLEHYLVQLENPGLGHTTVKLVDDLREVLDESLLTGRFNSLELGVGVTIGPLDGKILHGVLESRWPRS